MRVERSRHGFSLLELMVSIAIVSLILAAVTSVVISVSRRRQDSTALVDTRTNGRVALSMIAFDGANAGYRFGAPPFAVRVLQNITGTEAELGGGAVDCGGGPDGAGWRPLAGTDVIEFREGAPGVIPGRSPINPVGCNPSCTLVANGGVLFNPFVNATDGAGAILVFSGANAACATAIDAASNIGTGNMRNLKLDLRTNGTASTYPSAGATACPAANMAITALGRVTRYLVCSNGAGRALFRQRTTATPVTAPLTLADTARVQDNIEDLQVATLVADPAALVTGSSCLGAGLSRVCWCNAGTGPCAGFDDDPTTSGALDFASATTAERTPFLIRGFRIAVIGIAERSRRVGEDLPAIVRPALYDHAAGAVTNTELDGRTRAIYEQMLTPKNITMVIP